MARNLDGVDDYFQATIAEISRPYSWSGWCIPSGYSSDYNCALDMWDASDTTKNTQFTTYDASAVWFIEINGGGFSIDFGDAIDTTAWQQIGGVINTASPYAKGYFNGVSSGFQITTERTCDNIDTISWGGRGHSGTQRELSGQMGGLAVWAGALSDADMAVLALGIDPRAVRPDILIHYWPMMGRQNPEPDVVGGADFVLQSAPTAFAHHRIIRRTLPILGAPTPVAGGDGTDQPYPSNDNPPRALPKVVGY